MKSNEGFKIRSIRDGNWYWINRTILKNFGKELKSTGIAVYNVLASFADSKTQSCFPSQRTIADLIQVSRKTVIKNIRILEKLGLISIEKKNRSFSYLLLKPDVKKGMQGCEDRTVPEVKGSYSINNDIKRNNNNIDSEEFSNNRNFVFGLAANPSQFSPFSPHFSTEIGFSHPKSQIQRIEKQPTSPKASKSIGSR